MKPREDAIHLAAECWCDEETSHKEMDATLAMAFAKRLEVIMQERDALKAQVDELSGHSLAQADEIKQLKIYLTNYQNDMIEKNRQLEIAVKALDSVFKNQNASKGDWHRCREALAEIQKMRGV